MIKKDLFKKKTLNALLALGFRRIATQLIQTTANIILARILFPTDFGIFALILLLVNIFTTLSDVGLNAALVQKNKEPTLKELRTVFTTLFFFGIFSGIIMLLITPPFFYLYRYQIPPQYYYLFFISVSAPIFFNLKLISYTLLERAIRFKELVIGEIFEIAIMSVSTLILALNGYGVASLVFGLLISRIVSAAIFFILSPWKIGFYFSFSLLKKFLNFGIPFQINTLVGLINGSIAPVVVGGLIGTNALGLVNWAGGVGAFPRMAGDVVGRIIFPAASRVQKNNRLLKTVVERSIQLSSLTTFPIVAIQTALAEPLTYIVFTSKWADAIPSLYFFILQSAFLSISVILINTLLALGKSKLVQNISLFWVGLQILLTIILIRLFGFVGFAIAGFIVSLTFFIPLFEIKKTIQIDIFKNSLSFLIYSLISGILVYLYRLLFPIKSILDLMLAGILGILIYTFLIVLFKKEEVKKDFQKIFRIIST